MLLRYCISTLSVFFPLFFSTASAADRAEGQYALCVSCHGVKGEGVQKLGAPAIAGLPAWYIEAQLLKFREGVRGTHPKDLGGMRMRPMARALNIESDVKAVSAYVAALPRPELKATVSGSIAKGEVKYQQVCVACHGAEGAGMEALGAPPLVGGSDWYFVTQLGNYKNGVRGADARDISGMTMRPMAMQLSDADMLDVVAYINILKRFKGQ